MLQQELLVRSITYPRSYRTFQLWSDVGYAGKLTGSQSLDKHGKTETVVGLSLGQTLDGCPPYASPVYEIVTSVWSPG